MRGERESDMTSWRLFLMLAAGVLCAPAQPPFSFADRLYPVLEKAGCPLCHNPEGVASPTRLHFPEAGSPKERIEAFGNSLAELVDRHSPGYSILLNKPTNRLKHSGGERIKQGSPEEALLKAWIGYLATLPESELTEALHYKETEAAGHGMTPQVVL